MNQFYNQDLRVQGGNSFSSAMFRFSASPREYSRRLGEMLIEKMGVSESIKLYDSDTYLIIAVNDNPMIIKDYYFVESKRQEGVYSYEDWLRNKIVDLLNS